MTTYADLDRLLQRRVVYLTYVEVYDTAPPSHLSPGAQAEVVRRMIEQAYAEGMIAADLRDRVLEAARRDGVGAQYIALPKTIIPPRELPPPPPVTLGTRWKSGYIANVYMSANTSLRIGGLRVGQVVNESYADNIRVPGWVRHDGLGAGKEGWTREYQLQRI